jgi:hypothetical protein
LTPQAGGGFAYSIAKLKCRSQYCECFLDGKAAMLAYYTLDQLALVRRQRRKHLTVRIAQHYRSIIPQRELGVLLRGERLPCGTLLLSFFAAIRRTKFERLRYDRAACFNRVEIDENVPLISLLSRFTTEIIAMRKPAAMRPMRRPRRCKGRSLNGLSRAPANPSSRPSSIEAHAMSKSIWRWVSSLCAAKTMNEPAWDQWS